MDHKITVTVDDKTFAGVRGLAIVADADTADGGTPMHIEFAGLDLEELHEALTNIGKGMPDKMATKLATVLMMAGLKINEDAQARGLAVEPPKPDRAAAFRSAAKEVFGRD